MLNISLTKSDNILNGIVCYEKIDYIALDKLINSNLLKDTFKNPFVSYPNEKTQLIKYKDLLENNKAKIIYNKSDNNPFGRSNPKNALGLFSIRKEIRHTLAKKYYIDIDIDSCHHAILYQICEHNNIKCELLKDYVMNRQNYLDIIQTHYNVTKDIAKNLFIRILYCGSFIEWSKDNNITKEPLEIIDKLKKEFNQIANVILENNEEIKDYVIKTKEKQNKRDYNLMSSVCSYFLQEYEVRILSELYKYCIENEYIINNVCVLCADGLMIEKQYFKKEILNEFNILIKNKFNLNLNFSVKNMDLDYLDILDKNLVIDLYTPSFSSGILADYFKLLYCDKFLYTNDQLYYYNGVYWKSDDKKLSILNNFVDSKFYIHLVHYVTNLINIYSTNMDINNASINIEKLNLFLKNIQTLRKVNHRDLIVKDIINKISNNDVVFDSNPYLFAFNNKIFDLKTDSFIEPSYDQYIKTTVGYDYSDYYNVDKIIELDKLIDTILPDKSIKDYYLTILSTCLYGEQLEYLFIATGKGGNGKSLLTSLLHTMLSEYAYKLSSNVLLQEIKDGGNPQIALMNNKRFCFFQEPDKGRRLCSSTLKELTGDKKLNVRKLHSNECTITLKLTLILECNELPHIDEVNDAINRRLRIIPFTSKFVKQEDYDILTDKTNVFVGNPYYKKDEFQDKYKQALFEILRKYFIIFRNNNYTLQSEPEACKIRSNEYLACSDDIYDWFSTIFVKCNNSEDEEALQISNIYQKFTCSSVYQNMSKLDKRKYTAKYFNEKLKTNLFLQNNYKSRGAYVKGTRYNVPIIIGYKIITEDTIDDIIIDEN